MKICIAEDSFCKSGPKCAKPIYNFFTIAIRPFKWKGAVCKNSCVHTGGIELPIQESKNRRCCEAERSNEVKENYVTRRTTGSALMRQYSFFKNLILEATALKVPGNRHIFDRRVY